MSPIVYVYTVAGIRYRIKLDVDAICKTAAGRAARSKTGKARLIKGSVTASRMRQQARA